MNCRHRDFQSRALPAELSRPAGPAGRPRPSAFEKVPRGAVVGKLIPAGRAPPGAARSRAPSLRRKQRRAGPCLKARRVGLCAPWPVLPMTTATAGAANLAPSVHPATGMTDESPSCATRDAESHPASPPAVVAVTRCTAGCLPRLAAGSLPSPRSGPSAGRAQGARRACPFGLGLPCRGLRAADLPRRTRLRRVSGSRRGINRRDTPGGATGAERQTRAERAPGHARRSRASSTSGRVPGQCP